MHNPIVAEHVFALAGYRMDWSTVDPYRLHLTEPQ